MKEMEKTSQKSKRGQDRAKPDQLSCCYSYLAVAIPAPAAGVNQAWAGGSHWALRFLFCSGLSEYLFLELEATHSLSTIRRSFGLYLYRQIYPEPSPFLSLFPLPFLEFWAEPPIISHLGDFNSVCFLLCSPIACS